LVLGGLLALGLFAFCFYRFGKSRSRRHAKPSVSGSEGYVKPELDGQAVSELDARRDFQMGGAPMARAQMPGVHVAELESAHGRAELPGDSR